MVIAEVATTPNRKPSASCNSPRVRRDALLGRVGVETTTADRSWQGGIAEGTHSGSHPGLTRHPDTPMTDRALPATPSRPAPHQDQLIEPEINCQLRGVLRLRCTTDLSIRGWYLLRPTGIPAIPRRVEPDRAGPAVARRVVARRVVAAGGVKGRMCGTLTRRISIGYSSYSVPKGVTAMGESRFLHAIAIPRPTPGVGCCRFWVPSFWGH